MDTRGTIFSSFWSEKNWLPPNTTWNDVKTGSHSNIQYSESWHLLLMIAYGVALTYVREFIETSIFTPFGKWLGVKDIRCKPPPHNVALEKRYKKNQRLHLGMAKALSKQTDMSEREIEYWWMMRRAQDKPTILNKFCETSFKGLCYTWNFSFGVYLLWNKDFWWDFNLCFKNYPHHPLENGLWWYYVFVIGYYWSVLITHFYEAKRFDFYQMLLHHILAISIFSIWFITNMHRFFLMFNLLHDIVEYLLHITKAVKYAKYDRLAQILFIIFTLLWTPTRLIIYPIVLYRYTFIAPLFFTPFPVYYIPAVLMIILLCLHIFWTYLIYKVIFKVLTGSIEDADDIRSSCDEMEDDD